MYKKCTKSLLFLLLICVNFNIFAYNFDNSYIQNYKINIKVNRNNTYNVEEEISYYFDSPSRGIYRVIPIRAYDNRKIIVSNFTASENIAKIEKNNDAVSYVLGSFDRYLTGTHKYNICYTYDVGSDRNDGFDAFYYNLIGTSWDVPINNVEFKITFPEATFLSLDNVKFYKGLYGETIEDGITYKIQDNVIVGETKNLRGGEALTSLVSLSDGYFQNARILVPTETIVLIVLIAVLVVLLVYMIVSYAKTPHSRFLTPVVSAYPEEGITPLDARYLYKKTSDSLAISGAILNFAENGFIKIEFNEKKSVLSKDEIILHKIKDADDSFTREENVLFDTLFKKGNYVNITDGSLNLGETVSTIKGMLSSLYSVGDKAMYEKASVSKKHRFVLFIVLEILLSLGVLFASLLGFLGLYAPSYLRLASFVVFVISICIEIPLSIKVKARTEYYSKVLENLIGLKDFIETVEKEKLETLIDEDPHYFYKTLSYAIPLECEKKWTKKFEKSITLECPDWLYGDFATFNYPIFIHFSRSFYSAIPTTIANARISNLNNIPRGGGGLTLGDGGSIGGGFSGGGFGGGGGGRW